MGKLGAITDDGLLKYIAEPAQPVSELSYTMNKRLYFIFRERIRLWDMIVFNCTLTQLSR